LSTTEDTRDRFSGEEGRAAALFALRRQGLTGEGVGTSLVGLAGSLGGIQAQVPQAALLQGGARLETLDRTAWDEALLRRRTLARCWTLRGTVHVTPVDLLPTFLAALGPMWFERQGRYLDRRFGDRRRALMTAVLEALERHGGVAATGQLEADEDFRRRLRPLLPPGLTPRGILYGAFKDACYSGLLVHAGSEGSKTRYALASAWLGRPLVPAGTAVGPGNGSAPEGGAPLEETRAAAAEMLRLYLRTHAPASVQDFAHWSGLTVAQARAARESLGPEVEQLPGPRPGRPWLALAVDRPFLAECRRLVREMAPADYPVRLLPEFDDLALAHADHSRFLRPEDGRFIYTAAAHVQPLVLAAGRAVGTWRRRRRGRLLELDIRPFPGMGGLFRRRWLRRGIEAAAVRTAELCGMERAAVVYASFSTPRGSRKASAADRR